MPYLFNDPSQKNRRRKLRKDQTDAEKRLWKYLRNRCMDDFKFFRQYGCGPYILDFYCPQKCLAIELDGGQHLETTEHDKQRTHFLNCHGIHVMRFWDNEVLKDIDAVVNVVWQYLTKGTDNNNSP